ncbi:MAG: bifunctional sulfate adenylyltransferase/adenylylsulfate kinase [Chromatiales bacterium]|jgi:sulfate adenylyltransferase|nr:bifunctional sulfate adenylyltransferase/adenylylsulfate kinase [Chromatiales bacterium]MDH3893431.1 bifunctional sulfate adenylyltransferase/adenylylsulfate kinase [Chromatiales bacterium]
MSDLIRPHGGELKDLYLGADEAEAARLAARDAVSWDLTPRQVCDIELLLNGAFSPLTGFLGKADYDGVVADMRLADGTLWPMPITLDVTEAFAAELKNGDAIALRDEEGVLIAMLDVEDIWTPDKAAEAKGVFGSTDETHPGVHFLMNRANPVYVGGRLRGVEPPLHYDFRHLRDSPKELRDRFSKLGWRKIVAFQTRNPMHRAHQELTFRAARDVEANLLIHPVVGMTKPGDVDHFTRVRCYENLLSHYPEQTTSLSLLPLAMRMAGPREAVWHALIRKNYGCTHFIVGRDHAGPGKDRDGNDFYGPYDAQELMREFEDEIGIQMVPFKMMVYVAERAQYVPVDQTSDDQTVLNISGTELRRRLQEGLEIPSWFSYPDVIAELRRTHPARHQQGFCMFFTGLSGAGKSTLANALMVKLMELGGRRVTLLDGDIVRKNLSSELGFSREHRDLNIRRIGYVASEIVKNGGIAICAPIAPYTATRRDVRDVIEEFGGFIEVHVATSLEICEERDRKGLYAKARAGLIKEFTGISDPYEVPENAEMTIDTATLSPEEAAQRMLVKLESLGYIR